MVQLLQIDPMERVALQLLADGKSTSELAAALQLSESDIDARLAALFTRMGVTTQREAAAECVKRGLLFAGDAAHNASRRSRICNVAELNVHN